jgi:hypothetical protein
VVVEAAPGVGDVDEFAAGETAVRGGGDYEGGFLGVGC